MESLRHFPLGARMPNSPHAVISSLPTMRDVRGYEEKDPQVLEALKSGYPRFVVHEYVRRLTDFYLGRESLTGRVAVLVPGRRAADDLLGWLGRGFDKLEVDESVFLVFCEASDEEGVRKLRKTVQHTGCGISSRQAEDLLMQHGLKDSRFEEASFKGSALTKVEANLAELVGCRDSDVLVCASGMNAFYAGFRAVQEFSQSRGRTAWIQLGWLYLDSGKILQQFLDEGERLECVYNVLDIEAVLDRIRKAGNALASVVVECPSNPLIRIGDMERIAAAVREQGGVLMADPTIASVYNVDVLPYADILVTSLTKYAAVEGDIMIGALAVNPGSTFYGDLALRTSSFYLPPYSRDLARLAHEMDLAPEANRRMNANAARLAGFLRGHPAVKRVYQSVDNQQAELVCKEDGAVGAVITLELEGNMEKFYDHLRVIKGPSFGTRFTVLCPFMYLAHYDLVTTEEGRKLLATAGIDPELVRLSVGEEPYGEIEAVFAEALDASLV